MKVDDDSVIENKLEAFESYGRHYPKSGEEMNNFIFRVIFKFFGYSIREEQIDQS